MTEVQVLSLMKWNSNQSSNQSKFTMLNFDSSWVFFFFFISFESHSKFLNCRDETLIKRVNSFSRQRFQRFSIHRGKSEKLKRNKATRAIRFSALRILRAGLISRMNRGQKLIFLAYLVSLFESFFISFWKLRAKFSPFVRRSKLASQVLSTL